MILNESNTKPLMSVLMTSYNREKYIAEAIESVLASSFNDFELIIVDDGSTDSTVEIARRYETNDNRVRVYVNEKNLGDYPNRNKAAAYAKGKYIKYVDSDDYIYPNGLEIMVKSMEAFPNAGFGMASMEPNNARPFPYMLNPKESYETHFFKERLFHKGPLDAIILRSAFNALSGFPSGRMISDTDMWHRMGLHYPIVLMPQGIVWQRRHLEQELTEGDSFLVPKEKIKWKYLMDSACQLSIEQLKAIKKKQINTFIRFSLSQFKKGKFRQGKSYLQCLLYVLKQNIRRESSNI